MKKSSPVVGIVLLLIVHFSFTIIITWDTADYHMLAEVLKGQQSWEAWDPKRGIIFPFLIAVSHFLFGFSVQGSLILTFYAYVILAYFTIKIIQQIARDIISKYVGYIFVILCILLNPIIVGYYHTLLTEFVAATLMIMTTFYALKWKSMSFTINRLAYCNYSLFFIILTPIAWHLKQPYITIVLLPVCGAIFLSIIDNFTFSNIVQRGSVLFCMVIVLIATLFGWNNFLIRHVSQKDMARSSQSYFPILLLSGLERFNFGERESRIEKKDIFDNKLLNDGDKSLALTLIEDNSFIKLVNVYDYNDMLISQMIFPYSLERIRIHDALRFWVKCLGRYPILVVYGYIRYYLGMINLYQLDSWLNQKQLLIPKFEVRSNSLFFLGAWENNAIAYRVARVNIDMPNIFYLSDELIPYVKPYYQVNEPPILFKRVFEFFIPASNFTFSILLLLLPFLFCIFSMQIVRLRYKKLPIGHIYDVLWLLSFISFFHILLHTIMGAIIDRYVFPVYPLVLFIPIIILIHLVTLHMKKEV